MEIPTYSDAEESAPDGESMHQLHVRCRELIELIDHQSARLALMETKVLSLERLNGLLGVLLKHSGQHLDMEALFRAWSAYLTAGGKLPNDGGSKADVEAAQPQTKREMQEHFMRRLREEIARLHQTIREREDEIEALKQSTKR